MSITRRQLLERAAAASAVFGGKTFAKPQASSSQVISVVVESALAKEIGFELDQHAADLAAEGIEARRHLVSPDTPPLEIRSLLTVAKKSDGERYVGALLVGNVPSAQANRNSIDRASGMRDVAPPSDYWHAHPCDAYYMNLRGDWKDSDGDGVFDIWEGDRRPDLWVSRLRADTVAKTLGATESELMRRYFAKNHAYRRGELALPPRRALVAWYTIDVLRSQKEGGWGCAPEIPYGSQVEVFGAMADGEAAARGFKRLLSDPAGFELGVINCVTFWDRHNFRDGGEFTWDWVNAAEPKRVLWYHMMTSEPGRFDHENYLAGIYLFSKTPTQLLFCGTQHSGVIGAPTLYPDLTAGKTFGDAFRRAFQYETERWGEPLTQYASGSKAPDHRDVRGWGATLPATVMHGDGSLKLPS